MVQPAVHVGVWSFATAGSFPISANRQTIAIASLTLARLSLPFSLALGGVRRWRATHRCALPNGGPRTRAPLGSARVFLTAPVLQRTEIWIWLRRATRVQRMCQISTKFQTLPQCPTDNWRQAGSWLSARPSAGARLLASARPSASA